MNSTQISTAISRLPRDYLSLLVEFPLRPIQTILEYERAAAIIHRLALRDQKLSNGQLAYLEVLVNASVFILPVDVRADAA